MTPPIALELIDKAFTEKASFLDLGNCGLTAIPEEISRLTPFLKELNLGEDYFKDDKYIDSENKGSRNELLKIKANFPVLQKIQLIGLYLCRTHLSDNTIQLIAQYTPKLISLQISNNQLTAVGTQHIANNLNNLTSLIISGNRLTDVGAQHIASNLKNLTSLQISNNQLTDVGTQHIASNLKNLTSLVISGNQLTDEGAQHIASNLKNLTSLQISNNQLTAVGTQHIASNLKNLTSLVIWGNQLTDEGAQHIASNLKNLTSLVISGNQLTDEGAQHIASNLKNLTSLVISGNQLTDEGAQHIASNLKNLTSLDISNNQLTETGIEKLIKLPQLTNLNFNEYATDTIPQSIQYNLKALRDYFKAGELVDNNFVKVILMGNTTAGKSSLADFLINKRYEPKRQSTHGIKLWKWITNKQNLSNALTVNIWDFGGQDYYHATHTLFRSDKTLFLLLHTDKESHVRNSSETDQYLSEAYWLGNIELLAGTGSLIWFVQSKYEPDDHLVGSQTPETTALLVNPRLYLDPALAAKMISNQFTLSIKRTHEKDSASVRSFKFFRENLIAELRKLATQQLPKSWVEVRDKHLPEWRKTNLQLTVTEFWTRCKTAFADKPKLSRDFDNFPNGLLLYLSGCGEIIWFQHNPSLADYVYLSVAKLSEELFTIMSLTIKDNQGVFTLSDQADADRIKVEDHLKVLAEFKLIFKVAGSTDSYIIPQYLPENPYTRHFQQLIQVAYVIRFAHYMPRSLVTRFLVTYGNTEGSYYWRYGAFFRKGHFHLFVQMDVLQQTVTIHISDGPTREKYIILQELFRFFTLPEQGQEERLQSSTTYKEEISRPERLPLSAKHKLIIQLSLDGGEFATIADLENAINNKITKVKSTEGNYITIGPVMHQLLNEGTTTPKKIFLSYAHNDEQYKRELDTHFSALRRSGLVETWQDREIMAGEDWDKVIKEAIKQSDIVLLMLSPDFMASDYIWTTELPTAKEHNTLIIPLFIRPCDFQETQFAIYEQQGLPNYENAKTRWIVSSDFPNRDEGYLKIVDGIKARLKER